MNILFDLDDTLYPEKTFIYQGFLSVSLFLCKKFNLDKIKVYLELIKIFKQNSF